MQDFFKKDLSPEEKQYLNKNGISEHDLFVHPTIRKDKWPLIMKYLSLTAAWGRPCVKCGQRIRSRYNHCLLCRPEALSYERRFSETSFVYVAFSESLGLSKVGISGDVEDRVLQLNSQKLGGSDDWRIKFSKKCTNAGRAEAIVHRKLKEFQSPTVFQTRKEISKETFFCPPDYAVTVTMDIVAIFENKSLPLPSVGELEKIKKEVNDFRIYLRWLLNPYRNDFNLLYNLYNIETGVRPPKTGDTKFKITHGQLDKIAKLTRLPKDFLMAWPRSPKRNDGVIEKWLTGTPIPRGEGNWDPKVKSGQG